MITCFIIQESRLKGAHRWIEGIIRFLFGLLQLYQAEYPRPPCLGMRRSSAEGGVAIQAYEAFRRSPIFPSKIGRKPPASVLGEVSLKEVLLFMWYTPSYLMRFLKGLRVFSESYDGILKRLDELQDIYKKTDIRKTFGDNIKGATEFIATNRNQVLKLKREQKKMFNQLFSIFIATVALIISVLALILRR